MRVRAFTRVSAAIILAALSALSLPCLPRASARVLYVDAGTQNATQDGASWSTAKKEVWAALPAAQAGDEIWVARGIYMVPGYGVGFTLAAGVALYGGFAGTETARSQRDFRSNTTVLDGGQNATVVTVLYADNAVVDGFTIRNGCPAGSGAGGIDVSGSVTISNNVITGNMLRISHDSAAQGAGICVRGGSPQILNNTIAGNAAEGSGGAISVRAGSPVIAGNMIVGNSSPSVGGVYIAESASLVNNTIVRNGGSGVSINPGYRGPLSVTLVNNVIAFNDVGVHLASGPLTLTRNDVYGNNSGNYVGTADATGRYGNISADPRLSDTYGDNHLRPGSPCIDAGDDAAVVGAVDVYGKRRIVGAHVDLGADESDGTNWPVRLPRIIRIAPAGSDNADGSDWAHAMGTVNGALAAARGGDEVWVAAGMYSGSVAIPLGVALYGGFAGTETQRSQRNPSRNAALLDGGGSGRVASGFPGAVLDGFTIQHGGVIVFGGTATIANNIIRGNAGASTGGGYAAGGVYAGQGCASVVITGNQILDNITGNDGGGIYAYYTNATITNNVVAGNTARYGGGIKISGKGVIANNLVAGNHATEGGGIDIESGGVSLINNTVVRNTATYDGGGIRVNSSNPVSIANTIIAFNTSGLCVETYSVPTVQVRNNDVYGNGSVNYRNLSNPTGTSGNISQDPLFLSQGTSDYHLSAGSPCINAGDESLLPPSATDLDGQPRVRGGHVDMGAYEVQPGPMATVSVGTSLSAPPAALDGTVYVGGGDGKLYAFASSDLREVSGFPVDISREAGTPVALNSRPAVYYGSTGKAIYLTTNLGHVVKVRPDGTVAWVSRPLNGETMSTPAVTPDGSVYVNLGLGSAPVLNFMLRLDEARGLPLYASPYLGSSTPANLTDRSAAIDARYCYVNTSGQSLGGLAVLNTDNLTIRSSFAAAEDTLPPCIAGASAFVATKSGSLYKVNRVTLNPEAGFGNMGRIPLGERVTAAPFVDANGDVYVGTASGTVWKVDGRTGEKTRFLGGAGAVTGIVVTRSGIVAVAAADGTLTQALADGTVLPSVTKLSGPPAGGPVYDPGQGRFFVSTVAGSLYSIPAM